MTLAILSAVVLATGTYVGYAAIRHDRPVTLPTPTGPYAVGRATFDWTDRTRTDPLAPRPGTPRELSVWLWYPAVPSGGRRAAYLPGAWNGLHFGSLPGLGETGFGAVRVHAYEGAPLAAGRFPIVVLLPGLGLAAPQYTALAEDLASHGYLVAGVTPTYTANLTVLHGRAVRATAAGNPPALNAANLRTGAAAQAGDPLMAIWAADARFAAGQVAGLGQPFAGHVDAAHPAYVGHSFGGAASLEACRLDAHCAGAVDLDGTQFGPVVRTGLGRPTMIVGSAGSCVTGVCRATDAVSRADAAAARTLLAASTGAAWCYELAGSHHFNFSDYASYYLAAPLRRLLDLGPIDGGLGLRITGVYLAAFLDHAVRSRPEPVLSGASAPYSRMRAVHCKN
ncbi:alpha/beta hydrolase [Actinoallomurus vinaceus]|uniref:Alpha/beta hydrolase n=1 Tax=Actinoallomurus vinaceus TaxID=1080074 RepID=A0ABP8UMW0_9ACTN